MMRFARVGSVALAVALVSGCTASPNRNPPPTGLDAGNGQDAANNNGQDAGNNNGQDAGNNSGQDASTSNGQDSGTSGKDAGTSGKDAGTSGKDGGTSPGTDGGTVATGANSVQIIADGYPGGNDGVPDVGFITIKVCAPGSTTNCATIDHISIDTGSVGLHIIASEIPSSILSAMPLQTSGGSSVTECYIYEDGYVYGSVRSADVIIAGEKAAAMPFMAIGDTSFATAPKSCSSSGKNDGSSAAAFGGKGIIGIAPYSPDCGSTCAATSTEENPIYYTCSGSTCTTVAMPLANQLPNPVSLFSGDNNGVVIDMPTISDSGAASPTGTLYFGVNTQADNMVGSQTVYQADDQGGIITIDDSIGKGAEAVAIFDSGTSFLAATVSSLTTCKDDSSSYCPASVTSETANFTGTSGSGSATFKIGNADTLYNSFPTETAFDDLGGPGEAATKSEPGLDIFGFPFFFGHKIYFVNEGATAVNITGPAYVL